MTNEKKPGSCGPFRAEDFLIKLGLPPETDPIVARHFAEAMRRQSARDVDAANAKLAELWAALERLEAAGRFCDGNFIVIPEEIRPALREAIAAYRALRNEEKT